MTLNEGDIAVGVSGRHLAGNRNVHVTAVTFSFGSNIHTFPQILFDEFPNLQHMTASRINLRNIEPLKNCSSLNTTSLIDNPLQVLKDSTFEECVNLQSISLPQNQIFRIETGAFRGLTRLNSLSLGNKK